MARARTFRIGLQIRNGKVSGFSTSNTKSIPIIKKALHIKRGKVYKR